MNFFKEYLILVLLLGSTWQIYSQPYKSEFSKIRSVYYQNEKQIYYEVKIHYYDLKDLHTVIDSMTGKYYLYGEQINISLGGVKTIMNDKNYLTIIEEEKQMMIGKKSTEIVTGSGIEMIDSLIMDSLLLIKPLKFQNPEIKGYRFVYDNLLMDSLDITFNKNTFFMNSMTIYYQSSQSFGQDEDYKPVISMQFINQKIISKPDLSVFSLDKYVSIFGENKVVATQKYKDYEIVNNLKF
jgi:hypothetical protein